MLYATLPMVSVDSEGHKFSLWYPSSSQSLGNHPFSTDRMFSDYDPRNVTSTFLLLSLPLILVFAVLYLVWTIRSDRKYQIQYPLLGHKESLDLREIVQTQWKKVILLCLLFDVTTHTGLAGQGTQIHTPIAL